MVAAPAVTATVTASASTVCPDAAVTLTASSFGIGEGPQAAPTGYAASGATSTADEEILNVTFGDLSNTTDCGTTGAGSSILNRYSDFTDIVTVPTVTIGTAVPFSVQVGTCGGNYGNFTNAYIDYNRNGVFETSEKVYSSAASVTGPHTESGTINIPLTAAAGKTKLRVFNIEGGSATSSPSSTYTWGETEDYDINILGMVEQINTRTISWSASPADATLDGVSTTSVVVNPAATTVYTATVASTIGCSTTASTTVTTQSGAVITTQPVSSTLCAGTTASFSVAASGPGLTYQWSKNGTAITGNATATTATLTLTGTTPADNGVYTVLVHPICGDDAVSDGVATLTINPLPTATIAGTTAVCTNGTNPTVTFTGANGTAPYTFTYSLNGGANQTLVSDGAGVATISAPITTAGTFVYTLKSVVDSSSTTCSQLQAGTATITVNAAPTTVTISGTTAVCSNDAPALLTGAGGLPVLGTYCTPTVGSTGATGDNITNVTFGGVNNTTGDGPGDYNYYSTLTANVVAGTATPISITPNSSFGQQFRVWIDMNKNGVFEATESVFATTTSSTATVTGSITVPTTAFNGVTRMRVADRYSSAVLDTQACGHTGYGEFEDYNVSITGGTDPGYVWTSSNGGLFTDAAGTVAYDGTSPRTTIYAKPSATSDITATYTNAAGCSNTGSTSIAVTTSTTTEYTVTACGTYNWSINGVDYTTSGNYTYVTGCHTDVLHLTISCSSVLNLKVAIQGYYDADAHAMRPVMANQGVGTSTENVDDIVVSLRDVTDYHVVASVTAKLQTNGDALCTYFTAPSGSFYVSVAHRNSVQVMSATPVTVGPTPSTYDFTTAASKAFGDNQVLVDGVYTMYSGDFNQDGFVDIFDFPAYDAANQSGGAYDGTYVVTDLNGDGFVDIFDFPIYDANNQGNVQAVLPYSIP